MNKGVCNPLNLTRCDNALNTGKKIIVIDKTPHNYTFFIVANLLNGTDGNSYNSVEVTLDVRCRDIITLHPL
jgi:hypothetical protein